MNNFKLIKRSIEKRVRESLFKGRAVIIYGPRRSGKTTLIKEVQKTYPESHYYNCEEPDINMALTDKTSTELKSYFGKSNLIFLDEAQKIRNIGTTIKLIVDSYPEIQIVATGSSSFDLSNKIIEPLTGRKIEFFLYPLTLAELSVSLNKLDANRLLETRIIYGMYPEIIFGEKETNLREITKSYLYKDALQYQDIRNPEIIEKLLQALALQIGKEVSYNELANFVEADKKTVQRYIRILEQAFVIYRLKTLSRNPRNDLKKLRKIYFWDTGIRNALINNLNPLTLRQDVGELWENFLISERLKNNSNLGKEFNYYFWRGLYGKEIDLIEELGGKLYSYEIKWKNKKFNIPKAFSNSYPDSKVTVVNKDNYLDFTT